MRAGRASGLAGTAQGPAMAVRLGQALMQCNILFAPHNPYSRRQVIAEGRRAPHVVQTGRNLLGRGLTFAKRQGSDLADRATLAYSKSYEWILRPTYFLRAPPMRARPAGGLSIKACHGHRVQPHLPPRCGPHGDRPQCRAQAHAILVQQAGAARPGRGRPTATAGELSWV